MNYEEEIKRIEAEKQKALTEQNSVYDNLVQESQGLYTNQNQQLEEWKQIQDDLVNKQVGFSQGEYERYKQDTDKEYQQEAKASNLDYQKFINPYGAQTEQLRQSGLSNAGYAESTKLGAFNTAQMRTATARSTMQKIQADFDAKIQEARLNGDTQLAQIALQQLEMKREMALQEFNYRSSTTQNKLQMGQQTDTNYYGRIQDTLSRQQQYEAQQEAIRQFNEQFSYQQKQDKIAQDNWLKQYNLAKTSSTSSSGGGGGGSNPTKPIITDTGGGATTIKTPYYSGAINPDTKNGTFSTTDSNGVKYQPNNVGGSKLSYSGQTVGQVLGNIKGSSGASLSGQKIWADTSGKLWYWDGSLNKYQPVNKTPQQQTTYFSTGGGFGSTGGTGGARW